MMNHRLGVCALMTGALILLTCRAAAADQILLAIGIQDGLYYGKISGEVAGAMQVRLQREGSTEFDVFEQAGDEFWLYSPRVNDLDVLNTAIAGGYTIEIDHPGGTSVYTFNVQPAQASWIPNEPSLQPVPPAIPPQYTFAWAWSGTADAKIVELQGWNPGGQRAVDESLFFSNGQPGFDTLNYDADFGDFRGSGSFKNHLRQLDDEPSDRLVAGFGRRLVQ